MLIAEVEVQVVYDIDLEVSTTAVTAKSRKLKARWSLESVEDLRAMYSTNISLFKEANKDYEKFDFEKFAAYLESRFISGRGSKTDILNEILEYLGSESDHSHYDVYDILQKAGFIKEEAVLVKYN